MSTAIGDQKELERLQRQIVNSKSQLLMAEKMLISSPKSKMFGDMKLDLEVEVRELEEALLAVLSKMPASTTHGKGTIGRGEVGLPASRVMVVGSGVLASLIYGKIQRVSGTGATQNFGLKHPNIFIAPERYPRVNGMLNSRFGGAGCWNEVTEVGWTSTWDDGFAGLANDLRCAVAGIERPFVLTPRDGCDVVVMGSRYKIQGNFEQGLKFDLDFTESEPFPKMGKTYKEADPAPNADYLDFFSAKMVGVARGLKPLKGAVTAWSPTRSCAAHVITLMHPDDMDSVNEYLSILEESGVPFTLVVPASASATFSTDVRFNQKKEGTGGSAAGDRTKYPEGEITQDGFDFRVDSVETFKERLAGEGSVGGGEDELITHESYAEIVVQSILLLDGATSRVIAVGPGAGGAALAKGQVQSDEFISAFTRAAGE